MPEEKKVEEKPKPQTQSIPEAIDILVVDMDRVLFEGKGKSVIAPGSLGDFAILPGHTPLFAKLEPGKLTIDTGPEVKEIDIKGGFAKITQFRMIILVGFEELKK